MRKRIIRQQTFARIAHWFWFIIMQNRKYNVGGDSLSCCCATSDIGISITLTHTWITINGMYSIRSNCRCLEIVCLNRYQRVWFQACQWTRNFIFFLSYHYSFLVRFNSLILEWVDGVLLNAHHTNCSPARWAIITFLFIRFTWFHGEYNEAWKRKKKTVDNGLYIYAFLCKCCCSSFYNHTSIQGQFDWSAMFSGPYKCIWGRFFFLSCEMSEKCVRYAYSVPDTIEWFGLCMYVCVYVSQ